MATTLQSWIDSHLTEEEQKQLQELIEILTADIKRSPRQPQHIISSTAQKIHKRASIDWRIIKLLETTPVDDCQFHPAEKLIQNRQRSTTTLFFLIDHFEFPLAVKLFLLLKRNGLVPNRIKRKVSLVNNELLNESLL